MGKKKLLTWIFERGNDRQKAGNDEEKRREATRRQEIHLRRLLPLLDRGDLHLFSVLKSVLAYRSEGERYVAIRFWELFENDIEKKRLKGLLKIHSLFTCLHFPEEKRIIIAVLKRISYLLKKRLKKTLDNDLEGLEEYARKFFILNIFEEIDPFEVFRDRIKNILAGPFSPKFRSLAADHYPEKYLYLRFLIKDTLKESC